MCESLVVCEVDADLVEKLKKFRFRKENNNAAIVMKIDKKRQLVILEEEYEDLSPDELKDELPERQPRFVVYSYKYEHSDGRISYPLCFIFSSPVGENTLPHGAADNVRGKQKQTGAYRGTDQGV
ncbi:glia maturation factor beta isoform X2 [Synchiropus splendidus]|uniref:glia maturation factor beta isoform X2 n=1 Tax=Synchiropus splendidus TaxID=270530 RepID=UPI00237E053A|nr:glia maturation factor beta isoform X2 [Synchiropus splendidus]